ncbi:MAG: hypothetical protein LBT43_01925 [Prevotella sp.]|jgi:hypothetical protein|nr:hypothetical protein [Prevotella sp.]
MSLENPKNGYDGYNAIEIDKGVLLFSGTKEGFRLFRDCMALFMDNLYNPLCGNTYFNIHYIESDNPSLRKKCDIALKFPDRHLPLQFPIKDECFTDTGVLRNSVGIRINGWKPNPEQIRRITDNVGGIHIPVRGDTFNISTLQEIAGGVSYNRVLLSGAMPDFRYEKEFLELARKMERCAGTTEANKLMRDTKDLASGILKRDYPDIRKEAAIPVKERLSDGYGKYDHLRKDGQDCYNAIETDNGVLLFSRTEKGKELFQKNLETYLDNFYNPVCDHTIFNLHYLECDSGVLKGMSDLAIRFPMVQQAEFPPDRSFFLDKSVLQYSLQEAKFSWNAEPYAAIDLINNMWDGKHLPVKLDGDTYNISVLKEIASMEFYYFTSLSGLAGHDILGIDQMPGFRYKDDFRELAGKAIAFSGHIHEYKVLGVMRDKANEILKRDYPNIRKDNRPSIESKKLVVHKPPQNKKGRGL